MLQCDWPIQLAITLIAEHFYRNGTYANPRSLKHYRITFPLLLIGNKPADENTKDSRIPIYNAILDTGATVSVFPEHIWRMFETSIRFCEFESPSGKPAPAYLNPDIAPRRDVQILGGKWTYRLGAVTVNIGDLSRTDTLNDFSSVELIGMFLDAPELHTQTTIPSAIIGLERSVLTDRNLERNANRNADFQQTWTIV